MPESGDDSGDGLVGAISIVTGECDDGGCDDKEPTGRPPSPVGECEVALVVVLFLLLLLLLDC
jgi:hypothetical protein